MNLTSASYVLGRSLFAAALFQTITIAASWAQVTGECAGGLPDHHPMGVSDFYTNSRVVQKNFLKYKEGIVSCVSNHDPTYPLYVWWLLPGPHGWVQPQDKLESTPRLFTEDLADKLDKVDGCLEYANRGQTDLAPFVGTPDDQRKARLYLKQGCAEAVSDTVSPQHSSLIEEIQELYFTVRNFFPSSLKEPKATMLQLDGVVGVKPNSSGGYQSYFTFEIKHANASPDGQVQRVTVRPTFSGQTGWLLPAYQRKYAEPVRLGENGEISFDVPPIKYPALQYASYEFLDENRQSVGGIDFPVFVPGAPQPR